MGASGQIVDQAGHCVLNPLERAGCACWETSEQRVAVVQLGENKCLDEQLGGVLGQVSPDLPDVVEGESTRPGDCSNVGCE